MLGKVAAGAAALVGLLPALPVQARARAFECDPPPPVGQVSTAMPIEGRVYDPARLAPLATGAGIRVAVVDSGVDDAHPQLKGAVAKGRDLLHDNPDARQDC